jgi:hypothetical protein
MRSTRPSTGAYPGRLIVGVDKTSDSETILEWAAVMGERLTMPVVAVTTADGLVTSPDPAVVDDGEMVLDPVLRLEDFRFSEAAGGDLDELEDRRLRIVAAVRNRHPRVQLSHAPAQGELAGVVSQMAGAADFIVVAEPAGSGGRSTSLSSYYRRYARSPVLIPPFDELRSLAQVSQSDQAIESTLVEVRKNEPSGDHGVLAPMGAEERGRAVARPSHWFGSAAPGSAPSRPER